MNQILSQIGSPIERAVQASKGRMATNRLRELSKTTQQVDERREQENALTPMLGSMPRSPFMGERDYLEDKRNRSEMTNLTSTLAGKGPATMRDGGVMAAGPVARLQQRASAPHPGAANADDDAYRFKMQQLDIQDRLDAREGGAIDRLHRLAADPDHDLFSGKTAARTSAIGDISRGENILNARNAGEAEVANYLAPGSEMMRTHQRWDKEADAQTLAPYTPAAINAQGSRDAAAIRRDGSLGAADMNREGDITSSALQALARMVTSMPFTPEDASRVQGGIDRVDPLVPGSAESTTRNTKQFPAARLGAFMQRYGFQSEQQAREYLQQQGYAVQ